MTEQEENRVRCLAGKKEKLTTPEMLFCSRMLDEYPGRYRQIYRDVRALKKQNPPQQ